VGSDVVAVGAWCAGGAASSVWGGWRVPVLSSGQGSEVCRQLSATGV